MLADLQGVRNRLQDLFSYRFYSLLILRVFQQDQEFIPSKTGHHVQIPQQSLNTTGYFHEDFIACFMPQRFIDILEPVEIEQQRRHHRVPLLGPCDKGLQKLDGLEPIGKAGQNIMIGQEIKARLLFLEHVVGSFTLGYIAHQDEKQTPPL